MSIAFICPQSRTINSSNRTIFLSWLACVWTADPFVAVCRAEQRTMVVLNFLVDGLDSQFERFSKRSRVHFHDYC
jgi:hypothetical protein